MRINEGGMIEIIRYRLPIYWACALINGDYSGLSEEEIQEIDAFLKKAEGYPVEGNEYLLGTAENPEK